MNENIIEVQNLSKYFVVERSFWGKPTTFLKAVDNVNLTIKRGETLGLVGESGCGKSTLGRTVIGLYKATAGKVLYAGREKQGIDKEIQMIFQDPYASLNPRMTVGDIVGESLLLNKICTTFSETKKQVQELLELVGLHAEHINRFPHEFSGGQRQRIGIARALASKPKVIICDEPISALDVSIQAQVVNLLGNLQKEFNLTYLFIAHDLSMVRYISHRVAVMYLGTIVESAPGKELYENPLHPYTKALLSAIPLPDPAKQKNKQRIKLAGELPNILAPPSGCSFSSRCPLATEKCRQEKPQLVSHGERQVACFLATNFFTN